MTKGITRREFSGLLMAGGAALGGLTPAAAAEPKGKKDGARRKVIFDTDIGIDDAGEHLWVSVDLGNK